MGINAKFGAMESLVVSPTAEPRGSSDIGDEFFFLNLFLQYTIDSASRARAAPLETELFGVETRVDTRSISSAPAIISDLSAKGPSRHHRLRQFRVTGKH